MSDNFNNFVRGMFSTSAVQLYSIELENKIVPENSNLFDTTELKLGFLYTIPFSWASQRTIFVCTGTYGTLTLVA